MSALSGTLGILDELRIRDEGNLPRPLVIANGETVYWGGYYALNTAGYLTELANTAGLQPQGYISHFHRGAERRDGSIPEAVAGDTSASEPPEAMLQVGGFTLENIPVAAGSDDQSDVGDEVYLYTDNIKDDCTFTRQYSQPKSIGKAIKRVSSGRYDVRFYSADEIRQQTGSWQERVILGTINAAQLEGTSAVDVLNVTLQGTGRIDRLGFRVVNFSASAVAGAQTFVAEIANVDITHPSFALGFGDVDAEANLNDEIAVTPTATNTFTDGQELSLEMAASGTGFTGGLDIDLVEVWADITFFI